MLPPRAVRSVGVVIGLLLASSFTGFAKSRYITVRVDTVPSGATLTIDGQRYTEGGVTPMKLILTPETHTFTFEKRGYRTLTEKQKISKPTALVFKLQAVERERKPRNAAPAAGSTATITLRTATGIDPTDTSFSINGKPYTRLPAQFPLQPGRYLIEVSKPNHEKWSRWIDVVERQNQEIEVALIATSAAAAVSPPQPAASKLPAGTGKLIINVAPNGAQVFVNGDAVGKAPWASTAIKAAVYQVRVSHPGFTSWEALVEVRDGETSHVEAKLRPLTPIM